MGTELYFDQKRYISSKHLSKIIGYSHDYISRLCREGKIDGRLVGRTWFVNEESLQDHKNTHKNKGESDIARVDSAENAVEETTEKGEHRGIFWLSAAAKKETVLETNSRGNEDEHNKDTWDDSIFNPPILFPENASEEQDQKIKITLHNNTISSARLERTPFFSEEKQKERMLYRYPRDEHNKPNKSKNGITRTTFVLGIFALFVWIFIEIGNAAIPQHMREYLTSVTAPFLEKEIIIENKQY